MMIFLCFCKPLDSSLLYMYANFFSRQSGLTGCTCGDFEKMFSEDSVASHLSDLFDHHSETYSVSANTYVSNC